MFRLVTLLFCLALCFCMRSEGEKNPEKQDKKSSSVFPFLLLALIQYKEANPPCKLLSCIAHQAQFFTLSCTEVQQSSNKACSDDLCKSHQSAGVEVISSEKSCSEFGFKFIPTTTANCHYNSYPKLFPSGQKCASIVVDNAIKSNLSIVLDNNALPTVTSTKPVNEFVLISKDDLVNIVFSERINSKTLTGSNITATVAGNPVSLTLLTGSSFVNILPSPMGNSWLTGQVYTITISGNIEDEYGNKMNQNYTFNFQAN